MPSPHGRRQLDVHSTGRQLACQTEESATWPVSESPIRLMPEFGICTTMVLRANVAKRKGDDVEAYPGCIT